MALGCLSMKLVAGDDLLTGINIDISVVYISFLVLNQPPLILIVTPDII